MFLYDPEDPDNYVTIRPLTPPSLKIVDVLDKDSKTLTSTTINASEEYTYVTEEKGNNLKWCFWLDNRDDDFEKKHIIKIESTTENKKDSETDFFLTSKAEGEEKKKENTELLQTNAILSATPITVKDREGKDVSALKVIFSKWLHREKVKVEVYEKKPTRDESKKAVRSYVVAGKPEIATSLYIDDLGNELYKSNCEGLPVAVVIIPSSQVEDFKEKMEEFSTSDSDTNYGQNLILRNNFGGTAYMVDDLLQINNYNTPSTDGKDLDGNPLLAEYSSSIDMKYTMQYEGMAILGSSAKATLNMGNIDTKKLVSSCFLSGNPHIHSHRVLHDSRISQLGRKGKAISNEPSKSDWSGANTTPTESFGGGAGTRLKGHARTTHFNLIAYAAGSENQLIFYKKILKIEYSKPSENYLFNVGMGTEEIFICFSIDVATLSMIRSTIRKSTVGGTITKLKYKGYDNENKRPALDISGL